MLEEFHAAFWGLDGSQLNAGLHVAAMVNEVAKESVIPYAGH